jgi:molybdate transport system substrate-binding protein
MLVRIISLAVVAVTVAGCAAAPSGGPDGQTLTVFAASSLSEPFRGIAAEFEAVNPGINVTFNFAGSQTLRTQLEHGATADVFASADWQQMAAVKAADLLGNVPEYFATNRLAVATPIGSSAVHDLSDLARPGVTIAVAAAEVPAGAYARESLALMAADAEFPADFAEKTLANVVTNETNVRAVAQKVALGEVDAGLIYETDAEAAQYASAFRVIPIPLEFNPAAQYPIAALTTAADLDAALAFIAFVQGDQGQAILREHGFAPPANVACPCAERTPALDVAAATRHRQ